MISNFLFILMGVAGLIFVGLCALALVFVPRSKRKQEASGNSDSGGYGDSHHSHSTYCDNCSSDPSHYDGGGTSGGDSGGD
jgi:hypothetical protein